MQIDGHHTLTYTLARMVGFSHEDADIISYSAQYVDDATNSGIIEFDNGAMFSRISSAHGVYDMKNHLDAHENHLVWVPFHFLPGNDGLEAGKNPDGSFIKKLVCKPYSDVAVDMLAECLKDIKKPYFLQRLGITMHVFADTFAHKGFAGVIHNINKVKNLEVHNYKLDFFDATKSKLLSRKFPMGHGAALTCPDMPFLKWSYTNGIGESIVRDNPQDFYDAAYDIFGQLSLAYYNLYNQEPNGSESEDNIKNFSKIKENLNNFISDDGEIRHKMWLKSLKDGDFTFGSVELEYIPKGKGSWKYEAIKQDKFIDEDDDIFEYKNEFFDSNWRKFHVALKSHRFSVINDILPKYNICAS